MDYKGVIYVPQLKYSARIKQVAEIFANETRDAAVIAEKVGCTERTIYRIVRIPLFHQFLDEMGYEGERHCRVRPRRQ